MERSSAGGRYVSINSMEWEIKVINEEISKQIDEIIERINRFKVEPIFSTEVDSRKKRKVAETLTENELIEIFTNLIAFSQNANSKLFGQYKKEGKDISELKAKVDANKELIAKLQEEAREQQALLDKIALNIPNFPDESVPDGEDEDDNVEIKKVLTPREFDFTPLEHWALAEKNGWIDFERGEITAEALRSARFERLFKKTGIDLQPDKISKKYLSYLAEGTDLLDGAKNLINHLFGKTRMVLATNGIADVQIPRISQSELSKYFDGLFISEELGFPKPDVRFFKEMFSRISDFEKAVIVGDNLSSDIQGGINADIDTCWFNPLKDENDFGILPTYEIENLMDLIDLVK